MKSILARQFNFQCVHHYEVNQWDSKKNSTEFGLCFNRDGHGHNYKLEAYVSGVPDKLTGMIINLRDLDQILKKSVEEIAGRHLNLEVDHFKTIQPTTENIVSYVAEKILLQLQGLDVQLSQLRLYETEQLWVDFFP